MKNLNFNQMENMTGGVCQSFPGNAEAGGRCFPQPCWAGVAFGLIYPTLNPTDIACPA